VARTLISRGARLALHDPVAADRFRAEQPDLAPYLSDSVEQVFDDSDAVVLITEWPQYLELDWAKLVPLMRTPVVLDGRHVLDAERLTRMGYRCFSVPG
jgi:UDPglucose 6-dehydrogenase